MTPLQLTRTCPADASTSVTVCDWLFRRTNQFAAFSGPDTTGTLNRTTTSGGKACQIADVGVGASSDGKKVGLSELAQPPIRSPDPGPHPDPLALCKRPIRRRNVLFGRYRGFRIARFGQ